MCAHPMCAVIQCVQSSNTFGPLMCVVIQYVWSSNVCTHPMPVVIQCVWSFNMFGFQCLQASKVCGNPIYAVMVLCEVIVCVPSSNASISYRVHCFGEWSLNLRSFLFSLFRT